MTAAEILERARGLRVLVVGDCMLDRYISGSASRISPEAPVPVVNVLHRRHVAGGAGNVAANVRSLGAAVWIAGVTGRDNAGETLRADMLAAGIAVDALVEDPARVTTTKTRVTASGQQIVRFDDENTAKLSEETEARLRQCCAEVMTAAHVCVVSDYAKGVAGESFCRWLIAEAEQRGVPVVVDPKSNDFSRYRGATVITPNQKEAATASGIAIHNGDELRVAADSLRAKIAPSALLITRGEHGMSLFEQAGAEFHLAALMNEVADVTGAGDTVAAALALALGAGADLRDAAAFANLAAAIAVSHHGTWAVRAEEVLRGVR